MQRTLKGSCPLAKDEANAFHKMPYILAGAGWKCISLRQVLSDICVFMVPHVCKTLQIYEKPYDLCREIMMKHMKTSGVMNEGLCSGECESSFLYMFIDFSD